MRILTVLGTRPEAIKLAPLIHLLKKQSNIENIVCSTGQHKEMLQQVFDVFDLRPDIHLDLMTPNQSLEDLTSKALLSLSAVCREQAPDLILVQGDTTTAFIASLAGFYQKIKIGHIEAGLRTGHKYSPFPEEVNRALISKVADYHFAPTKRSAENLYREDTDKSSVFITGNTVIDALLYTKAKIKNDKELRAQLSGQFSFLDPTKKLILVTGHRRENFDEGVGNLCEALRYLSRVREDIQIVYPVHLNPNVQGPVYTNLKDKQNIFLISPQNYVPFLYLMMQSYFIISDSGGIQEETPTLQKPLLITRDTTERPEVLEANCARLVGRDKEKLISEALHLLDSNEYYVSLKTDKNPFGDGTSSQKILKIIDDKGSSK